MAKYTVKAGDNPLTLSKMFNLPAQYILDKAGIKKLTAGQTLDIPTVRYTNGQTNPVTSNVANPLNRPDSYSQANTTAGTYQWDENIQSTTTAGGVSNNPAGSFNTGVSGSNAPFMGQTINPMNPQEQALARHGMRVGVSGGLGYGGGYGQGEEQSGAVPKVFQSRTRNPFAGQGAGGGLGNQSLIPAPLYNGNPRPPTMTQAQILQATNGGTTAINSLGTNMGTAPAFTTPAPFYTQSMLGNNAAFGVGTNAINTAENTLYRFMNGENPTITPQQRLTLENMVNGAQGNQGRAMDINGNPWNANTAQTDIYGGQFVQAGERRWVRGADGVVRREVASNGRWRQQGRGGGGGGGGGQKKPVVNYGNAASQSLAWRIS